MGLLSTHVLDTMRGRPAPGVLLELYAVAPDGTRRLVTQAETNADGRTDAALLEGKNFHLGCYEIVFHLGAYFRRQGAPVVEPPFFDLVPIRFELTDPDYHYHVPVIASPWTYSTYRGNPASKVS
jgi:5-hydroxyisourate hydrolase